MLASDISQPILYMYIYIYILPCDLLVDQLISELRGYGPLDIGGRALSLTEHWFSLPSDSRAKILRWLQ